MPIILFRLKALNKIEGRGIFYAKYNGGGERNAQYTYVKEVVNILYSMLLHKMGHYFLDL